VTGAIAQRYRGAVGQNQSSCLPTCTTYTTGYIKDYNYDNRLRYRNPPFFIDPTNAAWHVLRATEQVPSPRPPGA
jgi:hypothetical protein